MDIRGENPFRGCRRSVSAGTLGDGGTVLFFSRGGAGGGARSGGGCPQEHSVE
ncbi:MAG: hypothetical protein ACYC0Q_09585 [Eubacteriales bacterium]